MLRNRMGVLFQEGKWTKQISQKYGRIELCIVEKYDGYWITILFRFYCIDIK